MTRILDTRRMILALTLTALFIPGLAQAQAPNLNMISVGINNYKQPGMDLRFSAPDAHDLARALSSNPLFGRKDVNVLTNQQATLKNLNDAITLLERRATANSYSVLYLSGHGSRNRDGHFVYPSYEFDSRRAEATSLSGEAIYARLKKMPGKVFLIIDACHSGSTGWTKTHLIKPDPTNTTIVISSSLAAEYSLELPEFKNGAFTQAFLEALSGSGDANKNGIITLQEMHNYVYTRVSKITKGKQHMKTFVPTVALGNMTLAATPKASTPSGVVWQGKETLKGYGALSFAFENNGRVTMTDAKGRTSGTWSRQGDTMRLEFNAGRVVYSGRVSGPTFSGTASNGAANWNFNVARR